MSKPTTTTDLPWYANHATLVEFSSWLDERGEFAKPVDVIYFFEKPWKWESEYEEYRQEIDAKIGRIHAH